MTLFPVKFVKMSDCMRHCQKLGGRAPKVLTEGEWRELQSFMKLNFFGKKDSVTLRSFDGLWLSISDAKKEGEWTDYYTGETIGFIGPFKGGPSKW